MSFDGGLELTVAKEKGEHLNDDTLSASSGKQITAA
jgi:hypothetical protein